MLRTATLLVLTFLPLAALADDCAFSADRAIDLDAKGLDVLKLDTGAGDLVVEGVAGLARVEVRGKACASQEDALAQIQFAQQREGAVANVGTRIPEIDGRLFANDYAYMDVHVRMPAGLRLDLRDSSGDLEVSGLTAGVSVKDSSGDIRLHDLGGAVDVTDTSGDIIARKISGDFTVLSDSSGDIVADDVKGSAIVKEDSSGDIELRHVGGDARVDRDSSGDIAFVDIGRDAIVGVDGTGEITADGVKGGFTVGAKSGNGGAIRHHGVAGKVSLPPSG
ncbi:MAG TPA: hypothetical protein VHE32_10765 [Rhodanobacteraceae bacterium]|nr:hypothetical protein [Rhodanobacteraceae bacterium]